MKRWYIKSEGKEYVCSLLDLNARAKIANYKSDTGESISFEFVEFYDFAKAKDGKQQIGQVTIGKSEKQVAEIIFKPAI